MPIADSQRHTSTLYVSLQSGKDLSVTHIFLHEQPLLQKATELRVRAEASLRGVETGIGFIGSPQWAIGGALILGAVEALASNAAAKKALAQIAEASAIQRLAAERGAWIPISEVDEIIEPDPSKWSAVSSANGVEGLVYVHPQSEFLTVRTSDHNELRIRLASVDTYRVFPAPIRTPTRTPSIATTGPKLPGLPSSIQAGSRTRAESLVAAIKRDPRLPIDEKIELLTIAGGTFNWAKGSSCTVELGDFRSTFESGKEFSTWVERQLIPLLERPSAG